MAAPGSLLSGSGSENALRAAPVAILVTLLAGRSPSSARPKVMGLAKWL